MTDAPRRFRDAIRARGMEPPDVIEPGKMHRFPGVGKRSSNRAGWCRLFADQQAGYFGDWSSGFSHHWFSNQGRPRSLEAEAELWRQIKATRLQAEYSQQAQYAEAADRARRIWDAAPPAPDYHAYLAEKRVGPHNARLYQRCLVLPVTNFDGSLSSLQFIAPDGRKRLLSGGRKRGCFIAVAGNEDNAQFIIICEGWATGCTLAEAYPAALVLAAIDADNLESVSMAARRRWPSTKIVIAGDDDRRTPGNPGATKAKAAASASDAWWSLPQWPTDAPESLTDFNDLARWLTRGGA